jgi:hypothetical protein
MGIERAQFVTHQSNGRAVRNSMVCRNEQQMVLSANAKQLHPQQGTLCDVESLSQGRLRMTVDGITGLQVNDGRCDFCARSLVPAVLYYAVAIPLEAGGQHRVAIEQAGPGAAQGKFVQQSAQFDQELLAGAAMRWIQLLEQPETALRRRQRRGLRFVTQMGDQRVTGVSQLGTQFLVNCAGRCTKAKRLTLEPDLCPDSAKFLQ